MGFQDQVRSKLLTSAYFPALQTASVQHAGVLKEYGQGDAGTRSLETVDGDPRNVAAIVSNTPPYNQPTTARETRPAQPSRPAFLDNTTVR